MGEGYGKAALVIQILALGYFTNLVSGAASSIAVGIGKTEFEMRYGILTSILNLFLSIMFSVFLLVVITPLRLGFLCVIRSLSF